MKLLGKTVIAAASKVTGLLLASYGIMMMRVGVIAIIRNWQTM